MTLSELAQRAERLATALESRAATRPSSKASAAELARAERMYEVADHARIRARMDAANADGEPETSQDRVVPRLRQPTLDKRAGGRA
jgi:hypothetical protein